jgi:hypothetical protein
MARRPDFPGFEACLKMRHSSNGQVSEDGFGWLHQRAVEYLPQLIAAFWDEDHSQIQYRLVELICESGSPDAMPFILERLHDPDDRFRQ